MTDAIGQPATAAQPTGRARQQRSAAESVAACECPALSLYTEWLVMNNDTKRSCCNQSKLGRRLLSVSDEAGDADTDADTHADADADADTDADADADVNAANADGGLSESKCRSVIRRQRGTHTQRPDSRHRL